MSTKTTTKKTEKSTSGSPANSTSHILNLLAYVAVCFGGVALFVAMILSKFDISFSIISMIQKVANAIAWAVVSFLSFKFIKNRKKVWMWVVWTIAVVMIIVGIIL